MSDEAKGKAIRISRTPVVVQQNVPQLIEDAIEIIHLEISQLKSKVLKGKPLDVKEARILQGYIKSLVDLAAEARQRSEGEDLSKLTDTELIELVESLQKGREDARKKEGQA